MSKDLIEMVSVSLVIIVGVLILVGMFFHNACIDPEECVKLCGNRGISQYNAQRSECVCFDPADGGR